MKKIIFLALLIFLLTGCESIDSTNLSSIYIDHIKLGDLISETDLSNYTTTNRFDEKEFTYNFEEVRITTNSSGTIIKVFAIAEKVNIPYNFEYIEDVSDVLGNNYSSSWFDKEQRLKINEYIDNDNKIKLGLVFSDNSKKLVWVILSIL